MPQTCLNYLMKNNKRESKIFSDAFSSILFQSLTFLFVFLINIYLIKILSVHDFGVYNVLVLFATVGSMLFSLNLHEYFAIKISSDIDQNHKSRMFWTLLFSILIISIGFSLLLLFPSVKKLILQALKIEHFSTAYDLAIYFLVLQVSMLTFLRYFMFSRNVKIYNLLKFLMDTAWAIPLLVIGINLEIIFYSKIIAIIPILILSFYFIYRGCKKIFSLSNFMPNLGFLKTSFVYGIGTYLATLSYFLLTLTDKFMLSYLSSNESVGFYVFANLPFNTIYNFIVGTVFLIAIPYINKYHEEDKSKKTGIHSTLFKEIILFLTPILLFIIIFSNQIVMILGKQVYSEVQDMYPLLAVNYLVFLLIIIPKQELTLNRVLMKLSYVYLFGLVLNIAMNSLLIPYYAYKGAIISTLLSNMTIFILLMKVSRLDRLFMIDAKKISIFLVMNGAVFFIFYMANIILRDVGINQLVMILVAFILYYAFYVLMAYKSGFIKKDVVRAFKGKILKRVGI